MRHRFAWFALLLAFPIAGAQSSEIQKDSNADIANFEADFSSALARNDVAALKLDLSDDWRIINSDGSIITKERFLDVIASGDLKHDKMTSQDQTISRYGDTALVTGRAQSGGTYKGVAFQSDEVGIDVLIYKRGHWVCVFTQLTAVAAKAQ